jgi:hypothetical protein
MHKTLGILITSERHGAYLEAIARAAKRKRIRLYVHIDGQGVRLCLKRSFLSALAEAEVTICRRSADRFGITDTLEACYPNALTSPDRPALDIGRCNKRIVL